MTPSSLRLARHLASSLESLLVQWARWEGFVYGLSVHCFSGVLRVHYERFESEPRYRTMSVNDAGTNTAAAAYSPVQSLEKRIELKTKYKSILEACISQNFVKFLQNHEKN